MMKTNALHLSLVLTIPALSLACGEEGPGVAGESTGLGGSSHSHPFSARPAPSSELAASDNRRGLGESEEGLAVGDRPLMENDFAVQTGEGQGPNSPPKVPSLADLAEDVGYSRFAELVRSSGVEADLSAAHGRHTLLVPAVAVSDEYLDSEADFRQDQAVLVRAFIQQHVVRGALSPASLANDHRSTMLEGGALEALPSGALRSSGGIEVRPTGRAWYSPRGAVIEVDSVVVPHMDIRMYLRAEGFHLFEAAMNALPEETLSKLPRSITVLAPTDEAMRAAGFDEAAFASGEIYEKLIPLAQNHIVTKAVSPAELREAGGMTIGGAILRIQPAYDAERGEEVEMVTLDANPAARLHGAPLETGRGHIVPLANPLGHNH